MAADKERERGSARSLARSREEEEVERGSVTRTKRRLLRGARRGERDIHATTVVVLDHVWGR